MAWRETLTIFVVDDVGERQMRIPVSLEAEPTREQKNKFSDMMQSFIRKMHVRRRLTTGLLSSAEFAAAKREAMGKAFGD